MASVTVKHLSGLNFMSQVSCHFSSFNRSFYKREVSSSVYKKQSSAKRHTHKERLSGRSFVIIYVNKEKDWPQDGSLRYPRSNYDRLWLVKMSTCWDLPVRKNSVHAAIELVI